MKIYCLKVVTYVRCVTSVNAFENCQRKLDSFFIFDFKLQKLGKMGRLILTIQIVRDILGAFFVMFAPTSSKFENFFQMSFLSAIFCIYAIHVNLIGWILPCLGASYWSFLYGNLSKNKPLFSYALRFVTSQSF